MLTKRMSNQQNEVACNGIEFASAQHDFPTLKLGVRGRRNRISQMQTCTNNIKTKSLTFLLANSIPSTVAWQAAFPVTNEWGLTYSDTIKPRPSVRMSLCSSTVAFVLRLLGFVLCQTEKQREGEKSNKRETGKEREGQTNEQVKQKKENEHEKEKMRRK